jgi:hypothetical protein
MIPEGFIVDSPKFFGGSADVGQLLKIGEILSQVKLEGFEKIQGKGAEKDFKRHKPVSRA